MFIRVDSWFIDFSDVDTSTLRAFIIASVMAAVDGLRSAYAKVGELVYFGRMLDKIRLAEENKLPPGYNLGDQVPTWFDGNCCRFLQVAYSQIVSQVRLGHSDEQILQWAYETGKRPTQEEIMMWNSFMTKRGWRDNASRIVKPLESGTWIREPE